MHFNIIVYLCMQILVVFCSGLPMKHKSNLDFDLGSRIVHSVTVLFDKNSQDWMK